MKANIDMLQENDLEVGVWTVDQFDIAYQFVKDFGVDFLTTNKDFCEY